MILNILTNKFVYIMKKVLAFFSAMLLLATAAFAQSVSVTTPSQNLKLQFKSAERSGNDVVLTILVTNLSSSEQIVNLVGGQYQTGMAASIAYDNDGNVYELGNILVSIGNKSYSEQYCASSFPAGVPVKCHVMVKNLAPQASSFSKLKLCVLSPELDVKSVGACFEINNVSFAR